MNEQLRSLSIFTVVLFGTALSICTQENGKVIAVGNERAYSLPGLSLLRTVSLSPQSLTKGIVTSPTAQGTSQAKGWRGILPLRSTRRDVERIIGSPSTAGGSSYETPDERVFVDYSDGPCEKGWPYGWNVAADTVVTITVSPKIKAGLATLNLDESRYEKWQAGHISNIFHYTNRELGLDLEVDEFRGEVISVSYIPTATESYLQCPDASRRLPPGRRQADSLFKFDELVDIPSSYERERLDLFAAEIKRQLPADAYIIAYGGMVAHAGEAKTRADCAKEYLIKKHRLKAENIWAIDGGYRETRIMELYVESRGGDLPLARPTVRPSKVKSIRVKNGVKPCSNFVKTANHVESQVEEIRFSFHPRWRERDQDDVFLTVNADGKAEAVFNDYDGSRITRVYKGTLPKAEVSRLSERIRAALREANKQKDRNGVIREGDLFYLSVTGKDVAVEQSVGVVEGVPEVKSIVEELRVLWKRLTKTPLADAYIKTSSIENDRLGLLLKEGKLRFISFRDFPHELQSVVRTAISKSFGFIPLNQNQYERLKSYTTHGELYGTDGEEGYKLTVLLSQQHSTNGAEIYFGFDPTDPTRNVIENSLVLVVRNGGRAEAVFYDRDRSEVVGTYKGILTKAHVTRLTARIHEAIVEANDRQVDETIVRESDLFYLSLRFENGTREVAGGKVEDMPEDVRRLVRDLNLLWRRFKETARAFAYLKAKPIDKEDFESLKKKSNVQFAPVEDFPFELRKKATESIAHPGEFYPLTRAQHDELGKRRRLVIYNGSAYFLNLFRLGGSDMKKR